MNDKADDSDKVVFNPIKEISYQQLDEAIQLVTPTQGEDGNWREYCKI